MTLEEPEEKTEGGEQSAPKAKKHHRPTIAEMFCSLNKRRRVKLVITMLCIALPLLVFSIYCISAVSADRISTMDKYIKGSAEYLEGTDTVCYYDQYDEEQVAYHERLYQSSKEYFNSLTEEEREAEGLSEPYYCEVNVGVRLEKL